MIALIRILTRTFVILGVPAVVGLGLSSGSWADAQSGDAVGVRSGESIDLNAVYWISNCQSLLKRFRGVEILQGLPGLTLTIREEPVYARRQNCRDKVRGGTVVLTATGVDAKESGTLEYRVLYDTEDGPRESLHTRKIVVYPAQPAPSASPSPSQSPPSR